MKKDKIKTFTSHIQKNKWFYLVPDISGVNMHVNMTIYVHLEALKITQSNDGVVIDYQIAWGSTTKYKN